MTTGARPCRAFATKRRLVELGDTGEGGSSDWFVGNTGYSSGPHLHFAVSQLKEPGRFHHRAHCVRGRERDVLSINRAGNITSLTEGVSYQGARIPMFR